MELRHDEVLCGSRSRPRASSACSRGVPQVAGRVRRPGPRSRRARCGSSPAQVADAKIEVAAGRGAGRGRHDRHERHGGARRPADGPRVLAGDRSCREDRRAARRPGEEGRHARGHRVAGHRQRRQRRAQGRGRPHRRRRTSFKRKQDLFAAAGRVAGGRRAGRGLRSATRRRSSSGRARSSSSSHVGNVDVVTQTYALPSPIDGEVLLRNINPGIEVQGQYSGGAQPQELFTIGELDRVWVLGDIYEIDLGSRARRQPPRRSRSSLTRARCSRAPSTGSAAASIRTRAPRRSAAPSTTPTSCSGR